MATDSQFIERIERRAKALQDLDLKTFGLFDGPKQYLHSCNLYVNYFKIIPSKIILHHNDTLKLVVKIEKDFKENILERFYMRYSIQKKYNHKYSNIVFIMENEVMIEIELTGEVNILFNKNSEEEALKYEDAFRQRIRKTIENKIFMLTDGHFGLDLSPIKVKRPVIDFNTNYNSDLYEIHKFLLKNLKKKDNSGLVLFHGKPGTGKSTYIRYLICSQDKKVIFLPPSLAAELDSPHFTKTLIENPNSIFIIEDAEQLIKSRESIGQSNISMLLNLTDGILGEALNTHIICTFNTDHNNIDEALLRKGRLIASYKFDDLSKDRLEKLKTSLGLIDFEITEGMSLSDLYYTKNNLFGNDNSKKSAIGFV